MQNYDIYIPINCHLVLHTHPFREELSGVAPSVVKDKTVGVAAVPLILTLPVPWHSKRVICQQL